VRRTALILALVALGFYVGYIVLSMVNASHALHGRAPPSRQQPAAPR
jgi:hypothetical protein